ncbi:hypothetical protein ITP53_04270 [Nonomuraea sp. K274]|uniref:Uncharacterized protein n=1 Tax=Nonomuraea cypriaca TaxID=1187855 RepID=A0A931A7Q6_9ACTN|nr:hypothetical protein [Nonomuraea cypriaca]MBF8184964.1 hypothetical protein [Nonomuraea cypriaca]
MTLDGLQGSHRSIVLVAARSLFAFCRKRRSIFRNLTSGIHMGQHLNGLDQRLDQDESTRQPSAPWLLRRITTRHTSTAST